MILNGEMSEWSIEHAWKAMSASIIKQQQNTSCRIPINDLPLDDAPRCDAVNVRIRRRFQPHLTQFLHSFRLHLFIVCRRVPRYAAVPYSRRRYVAGSASRFKWLYEVPVRTPDLDLSAAGTDFHLVAKAKFRLLQFSDKAWKIRDRQHHPVPLESARVSTNLGDGCEIRLGVCSY